MAINIFQIVRHNKEDQFDDIIEPLNVNDKNEYGQNLLHVAIAHNATSLGRKLIKEGINVNEQDNNGLSPLHYADSILATLILDAGGHIDIRDDHYNNPIWTAVFNAKGKYEVVKVLVANGADALTSNKHGRSPLDFANQIKDEKLVEILELWSGL